MKKVTAYILAVVLISISCFAEDTPPPIVHAIQSETELIVIDPGFGGAQTGPAGCDDTYAKDINLQIAMKVAERIEKDPGLRVMLTRDKDFEISLEERCSLANLHHADLFISIHANGSSEPTASGTETYFLKLTTDPESIRIAARQNSTSEGNIADLEGILTDLTQNAEIAKSEHLANNVQNHLCQQLKVHNKNVKNRGTKKAPIYTLFGAQMPAITVCPGFITNPVECKLLNTPEYQDVIGIGIVNGIRAFMKARKTQTTTPEYR